MKVQLGFSVMFKVIVGTTFSKDIQKLKVSRVDDVVLDTSLRENLIKMEGKVKVKDKSKDYLSLFVFCLNEDQICCKNYLPLMCNLDK